MHDQTNVMDRAILEALATGVPVVTTDVGGMREAVSDGVEGFLVPSRDAAAIADALADLWRLRNDRSYSQRCARYQEYGDVRPYDASAVVLEAPVVLPRPAAPAPLRARPLVPETVGPRSR